MKRPTLTITPNQTRWCLRSVLNTGTSNTEFTARWYSFCDKNNTALSLQRCFILNAQNKFHLSLYIQFSNPSTNTAYYPTAPHLPSPGFYSAALTTMTMTYYAKNKKKSAMTSPLIRLTHEQHSKNLLPRTTRDEQVNDVTSKHVCLKTGLGNWGW